MLPVVEICGKLIKDHLKNICLKMALFGDLFCVALPFIPVYLKSHGTFHLSHKEAIAQFD